MEKNDSAVDKQRQVAVIIAKSSSHLERDAIVAWGNNLLDIRSTKGSPLGKAKRAIAVTYNANIIWPAVKTIAGMSKRLGWDNRSVTARFGIGAALISGLVFGGQSAGIAALGTAVGVPLWVVFGAGASFINVLREELTRPTPP